MLAETQAFAVAFRLTHKGLRRLGLMTMSTFICTATDLKLGLVQPFIGRRRQPLLAPSRCSCQKRHSALFLFLALAFGTSTVEAG